MFSNQKAILSNQKLLMNGQKNIIENQKIILQAVNYSRVEMTRMFNLTLNMSRFSASVLQGNQKQLQATADRIYRSLSDNHNEVRDLVV